MSPEIISKIDLPDGLQGGIVKEIHPSTNLAKAGVKENDILLSLHDYPIDENLNSSINVENLSFNTHITDLVNMFPSQIPVSLSFYSLEAKKIISSRKRNHRSNCHFSKREKTFFQFVNF